MNYFVDTPSHITNEARSGEIRSFETSLPLSSFENNRGINIALDDKNDQKEVSILFSDIRQFSRVIELLRLETSVMLLNSYYTRLLPEALHRGGELHDYLGDGLYISFPQNLLGISAPFAVNAALEMMREFALLLKSWSNTGYPISNDTVHGIGISTGNVYKGLIGYSGVQRQKLIGPCVNSAAHLCEEAKHRGGGVFICARTASLLDLTALKLTEISTPEGKSYNVVRSSQSEQSKDFA